MSPNLSPVGAGITDMHLQELRVGTLALHGRQEGQQQRHHHQHVGLNCGQPQIRSSDANGASEELQLKLAFILLFAIESAPILN